jgi:hypothetical protein
MPYRHRGLSDVLNPTAGSSLDCGLFAGGVFQKACWCLQFPSLCSSADYQAAVALANPDLVYAPIQQPPVVGAPTGTAATVAPASGQQAQETINQLLAEQMTAQQAGDAATVAQTQASLDAIAASQPSLASATNWWLYIGIAAVAVFALVAMGGGSPRRYGR